MRTTFYRHQQPPVMKEPSPRPRLPKVLSYPQRTVVLDLLNDPEHCDLAVEQVYARSFDEGI